jgi:hypothetical protein
MVHAQLHHEHMNGVALPNNNRMHHDVRVGAETAEGVQARKPLPKPTHSPQAPPSTPPDQTTHKCRAGGINYGVREGFVVQRVRQHTCSSLMAASPLRVRPGWLSLPSTKETWGTVFVVRARFVYSSISFTSLPSLLRRARPLLVVPKPYATPAASSTSLATVY